MDSRLSPAEDQASLSPTQSSLSQRDDDLDEVMALLEPRETESCPAGEFEVGNGGFLLEEDPATSSPRSDTSSKELDAGR